MKKTYLSFVIVLLLVSCTGETNKRPNTCYNDTLSFMSFKIFDSIDTIQQKLFSKELNDLVVSMDIPQDEDALYYNPLEVPIVQFNSHIIDNNNNKHKAKVKLFLGENPYLSKIVLTFSGDKFQSLSDLYIDKYGDPDSIFANQEGYVYDSCFVWNFAYNQQLIIDDYIYYIPENTSAIMDVSTYLPELNGTSIAQDLYGEKRKERVYIIYRDMSYVAQYEKLLEEKARAKAKKKADAKLQKEAAEKKKKEQLMQERKEQDI